MNIYASLKATEGGELKSNRKALVLQFCTDYFLFLFLPCSAALFLRLFSNLRLLEKYHYNTLSRPYHSSGYSVADFYLVEKEKKRAGLLAD
jgi:hypothetical protein